MHVLAKCADQHIFRVGDLTQFTDGAHAPISANAPAGDCGECGILSFVWSHEPAETPEQSRNQMLLFNDPHGTPLKCLSCDRFENEHPMIQFYNDSRLYALCLGRLERSEA
jgi:hypothetical protein|tara:strand:+ start:1801 stop:2133 length:333 start_codon:yes stop_codon:yes gene_type:complete